jgi:serine/threonine-protein kinase
MVRSEMSRTRGILACSNAALALVLFTSKAFAGADEKIAAEALFDEGKRLMVEGKFAVACDKLEQSERTDPAVGTLLYLAECYEKSGRPASAWATFREAASAARAGGQQERARIGQERAARLEPLLVKLTINVAAEDANLSGFTVKRSTESIPPAMWGGPVPVDPGDYTVEASAPGYESFSRHITVGKDSVSVDVPALRALPPSATPPSASASEPGAPTTPLINTNGAISTTPLPPATADTGGGGMSTPEIVGLVIAGAGVVSLGIGTVFGVNAISKNDDAKKFCPRGSQCDDPRGESLSKDANSAAVVANITVGIGAAALVGGGLLYFLSPSRKTSAAGVHFIPAFSAREVGAMAEGRF